MSNMYSDGLIEEVLERNDIIDVISEYVNLKRTGNNYKALCPFHKEKTPSFVVSQDKQLYHCFGCGAAGNTLNFIMHIENLDFIDALEILAERANIDITQYRGKSFDQKKIDKRKKLYEINREAALYFYKNLITRKNDGLKYFKSRGLSVDIIKKFGLGYAIDDWESLNRYLLDKDFDQELIYEAGLVIKRKDNKGYYDRFRNRVIFPIISPTKKVIGFGGRVLDDSVPKYLNSPESSIFSKGSVLYGLNLARSELGDKKRIIVVEGYTDVISLYQNGIRNVVATLGTAFTKNHGQLLKRYCDEVIIAFDSDTAGEAATLRGLDILEEIGCKVKVLRFDNDMDPDEYIRHYGSQVLKEKIEKALPLVDYKIELLKNNYNLETNEGKIDFIKESINILKSLKSSVERNIYITKVSEMADVPSNVIKSEIYGNNRDKKYKNRFYKDKSNSFTNNKYYNKQKLKPVKKIEKNGSYEIEKKIISLSLRSKTKYHKINSMINPDDFINDKLKNIYNFLGNYYKNNEKLNLDLVIDNLDIEESKLISEILHSNFTYDDFDKTLEELIISLERFKIDNEIYSTKKEIKILEMKENKEEGDVNRIKELCGKLIELEKKLMNMRVN
ncbi:MAG: primase [Candidatus Petromonas sp.]|nr:primase [Candidatus Petromonas sp.]